MANVATHRNKIRALRERCDLTLDQLAQQIGCSIAQLSDLERGTRRLNQDWLDGISKALNVSCAEILGEEIPLIRVTAMPADTNPYGGVFGGWLMSQMALAAGSLASRTAKGKCVVVAADSLSFTGAPSVGDEISVYADPAKQGRSSMTIAVRAEARERDGETVFDVAKGSFTFVALDSNDRPRIVAAEEPNG